MILFWRDIKDIRGLLTSVIIVIAILLIVFVAKRNSGKAIVIDCQRERQKEIRGKVDTAFFDLNINIKAFVIIFENGDRYENPIFLKSLNGFVKKGDSLYKPKDRFIIYRYENQEWKELMNQDTLVCSRLLYQIN